MSIDQDDDEHDEFAEELADLTFDRIANAVDRIADAICRIALSPKAIPLARKKLDKLEREQAAIAKENAESEAALDAREAEIAQCAAELAARSAEIERRKTELETSLREAHEHLRQYYDNLAQEDRRIRYRILSSANLLHGYIAQLQPLPSWDTIGRMIPDLPTDLPAPAAEVVTQEVTSDWTGQHNFIADSTLTRTVRGAA
jgi:hypothetical protein